MIELINVPHTLMFDALFSVLFLSKVSLQQLQTLKRISIYFLLFREIFDTKGQWNECYFRKPNCIFDIMIFVKTITKQTIVIIINSTCQKRGIKQTRLFLFIVFWSTSHVERYSLNLRNQHIGSNVFIFTSLEEIHPYQDISLLFKCYRMTSSDWTLKVGIKMAHIHMMITCYSNLKD